MSEPGVTVVTEYGSELASISDVVEGILGLGSAVSIGITIAVSTTQATCLVSDLLYQPTFTLIT
ncbi:hypothetical protein WIW90_05050 [Sulfolobaceae archaeon RB850M]